MADSSSAVTVQLTDDEASETVTALDSVVSIYRGSGEYERAKRLKSVMEDIQDAR